MVAAKEITLVEDPESVNRCEARNKFMHFKEDGTYLEDKLRSGRRWGLD